MAKHKSGELRCPATALINIFVTHVGLLSFKVFKSSFLRFFFNTEQTFSFKRIFFFILISVLDRVHIGFDFQVKSRLL